MDFYFLIFSGAFAGLLAGLFGIGGSVVIVPALIFSFAKTGTPYATQMAIGTAMASILLTGAVSSFSHHRRNRVEWRTVFSIAPFIVVGTLLGTRLGSAIDGNMLRQLFGLFQIAMAIQMALPKQEAREGEPQLPVGPIYTVGGTAIGTLSSLFGIGGGTLTVPLLAMALKKPIQTAIGTSAAVGVGIALFGTIGWIGQGRDLFSPWGFVNPEVALLVGAASSLTVPSGVRLALSLDSLLLSRVFAIFLTIVGLALIVGTPRR